MAGAEARRKQAFIASLTHQVRQLEERGVQIVGNATSPLVLVKGELSQAEAAGAPLLSGADGEALKAACSTLGWAPEDFCGL